MCLMAWRITKPCHPNTGRRMIKANWTEKSGRKASGLIAGMLMIAGLPRPLSPPWYHFSPNRWRLFWRLLGMVRFYFWHISSVDWFVHNHGFGFLCFRIYLPKKTQGQSLLRVLPICYWLALRYQMETILQEYCWPMAITFPVLIPSANQN